MGTSAGARAHLLAPTLICLRPSNAAFPPRYRHFCGAKVRAHCLTTVTSSSPHSACLLSRERPAPPTVGSCWESTPFRPRGSFPPQRADGSAKSQCFGDFQTQFHRNISLSLYTHVPSVGADLSALWEEVGAGGNRRRFVHGARAYPQRPNWSAFSGALLNWCLSNQFLFALHSSYISNYCGLRVLLPLGEVGTRWELLLARAHTSSQLL